MLDAIKEILDYFIKSGFSANTAGIIRFWAAFLTLLSLTVTVIWTFYQEIIVKRFLARKDERRINLYLGSTFNA